MNSFQNKIHPSIIHPIALITACLIYPLSPLSFLSFVCKCLFLLVVAIYTRATFAQHCTNFFLVMFSSCQALC